MFNLMEMKAAVEARHKAKLAMKNACLHLAMDIQKEIHAALSELEQVGITTTSEVLNLDDEAMIRWLSQTEDDGMAQIAVIKFDEGKLFMPRYDCESSKMTCFAKIADEPSEIIGHISREIKRRFEPFVVSVVENNLEEENA